MLYEQPTEQLSDDVAATALAVSQVLHQKFWEIAENPDFPFHATKPEDDNENELDDVEAVAAMVRTSTFIESTWEHPANDVLITIAAHGKALNARSTLGYLGVHLGIGPSERISSSEPQQFRYVLDAANGSVALQPRYEDALPLLLRATGQPDRDGLNRQLTTIMRDTDPKSERRGARYFCKIATGSSPLLLEMQADIKNRIVDNVPTTSRTLQLAAAGRFSLKVIFSGETKAEQQLEQLYFADLIAEPGMHNRPEKDSGSELRQAELAVIEGVGHALLRHAGKLLVAPRQEDAAEAAHS